MAIADDFPNGDGTSGDPYLIKTLAQLQLVNTYSDDDVYWKLNNNIDASATRTWNQGGAGYEDHYYGFVPIGSSNYFQGHFDGNNYKITKLYINRTPTNGGGSNMGLFEYVISTGAGYYIKDLTLENMTVYCGNRAGLLASYANALNTTYLSFSNCHVTGTIYDESVGASGSYLTRGIGGLIGLAEDVAVDDCSATVQIISTTNKTSSQIYGGLIGSNGGGADCADCVTSGSISLVYAASSAVYAGGFFGIGPTGGSATNCISSVEISVNVTGTTDMRIGGFAGNAANTCTECFSYGDIESLSSVEAVMGGFVGGGGSTYASKCGSEGNVENYSEDATSNCSGGFTGNVDSGTYDDCYAKGTVNLTSGIGHADARIGGFVGVTTAGVITNCYSAGEVYAVGPPTNGGGFQGLDTAGTQTACFFDNETSGYTTTDGDATGKSTTDMKTEATFTDVSWDFTDTWYLPTFTRTPGMATAVWLSKTGDYENFKYGSNDDDPIDITVPTTNTIVWVDALKSLAVGTSGDEWKVGSNKLDTPLTPTNFKTDPQSEYGSNAIQPVKINSSLIFIDFVSRKLREMTYKYENEKFVSPDLTSLAEHITSSGVTSVARQKNPDSILWMTLTDGSLISMTYERDQDVVAWAKHPLGGDGFAQSVCVTPGTSEDDIWLTVKRKVNSATVVFVEKMASRTFTDIDDAFFVDAGITATPVGTTVSGLDHLIGSTVIVLGDGVEQTETTANDFVVNASGEITVPAGITTAQVGLAYTYKLQPMRLVIGDSKGSVTQVHELVISFLNTLGAKYGAIDSDLQTIDFDDNRLTNSSDIDDLFTGEVVVPMPGNTDPLNPLVIGGDSPYPCTVRALVARLDKTGR